MKKFIIIIFVTLLSFTNGMAEDVLFEAKAPKQVISGRPFQLAYTVNAKGRNFEAPQFVDFEHMAGPYTSSSSSTTFVNGKRTSSFQMTYTYTLKANKEGTFTIGPASIIVSGEEYISNGVRITVLPPDQEESTHTQQSQQTSSQQSRQQNKQVNNTAEQDIFIRTIVSKTRVHEQEALLLTYRLYFHNVDVAQFTNNTKLPDFTGFLKQDIEQQDIQSELEHYNGRNYQTANLYTTLLYPQHAGDIQIAPATFEAVLRVATREPIRSIFDGFFDSYQNVVKEIKSPGVTIHVESLPNNKPASYSGGVGQFSLNSSISTQQLNINEAVTIHLDIKGNGNMKLLKTPSIDWPDGFEAYDPKVTNQYKPTSSGVIGTKSVEYLAIPRASGTYTIPPIKFAYFDIKENAYKVLTTPEYTLQVNKNAQDTESDPMVVSNYTTVAKEDIKQLGNDIRYIYTNNLEHSNGKTKAKEHTWINYGDITFWLCYLIPLIIAIILFIIFHKQIKENADLSRVRYKHANKVAQKRLKKAKELMNHNNQSAFYEEIERAAWSYLSDRLTIPTADLTKDNIADILKQKNVPQDLITRVRNLLSEAEFARYTPAAIQHTMKDLYQETTELINQLENQKL